MQLIFMSIQNQQQECLIVILINYIIQYVLYIFNDTFLHTHLQYSKIESVLRVIWTNEKYNNYFSKSLSNDGIHCIRVNNVV